MNVVVLVVVLFVDKNVNLGDHFEVARKAQGQVNAVKVTRNGMVLISWVSKEQKEKALRNDQLIKWTALIFGTGHW